jgi:hypothetical protein
MNIIEMNTKDAENHISKIDAAMGGSERTESILKEVLWIKYDSTA